MRWLIWFSSYTCVRIHIYIYIHIHFTSKDPAKICFKLKVNEKNTRESMKSPPFFSAPPKKSQPFLAGGFEYVLFSPLWGNDPIFDVRTCFKWVGCFNHHKRQPFFCQKKSWQNSSVGNPNLNSLGPGWLQATVIRAASEKLGFPIHLPGLVPWLVIGW